jgi:hypothetical protein
MKPTVSIYQFQNSPVYTVHSRWEFANSPAEPLNSSKLQSGSAASKVSLTLMPRVIPPVFYETIQVTGNILDILLTVKSATHCILRNIR